MVQSELWCPSKATGYLHTQRMFGMLEDRRNKTLEQMVDQNIVVHIEDKISKTWIALQTCQPIQSGLARLTDPLTNLTHLLYLGVACVCVSYASHSSHVYSLTRSLEFCVGTWVILGWCWVAVGVRCVAGQTTSGGIAGRSACMLAHVVAGSRCQPRGFELDCKRCDTLEPPFGVDTARGAPLADGGLGSVVTCGSCVGIYLRIMPGCPSLQSFTGGGTGVPAPIHHRRSCLVARRRGGHWRGLWGGAGAARGSSSV
jgi:hypothetical protein